MTFKFCHSPAGHIELNALELIFAEAVESGWLRVITRTRILYVLREKLHLTDGDYCGRNDTSTGDHASWTATVREPYVPSEKYSTLHWHWTKVCIGLLGINIMTISCTHAVTWHERGGRQ